MNKKLSITLTVLIIVSILPISGLLLNSQGNLASAADLTDISLPLVMRGSGGAPPLIIPETTTVLPPATLEQLASVSGDGMVYTFSQSTPELAALQNGDIIVGDITAAAPNGFLRKVTSISSSGGQVIVQTAQATMEEAIQSGALHIQRAITSADLPPQSFAPGIALLPPPTGAEQGQLYFEIEKVLYDHDGDEDTTNDQVKTSGTLLLDLSYEFDIEVENFALQELSFIGAVDETADLQISATYEVSLVDKEFEIYRHTLTPFTAYLGGFFPVTITPVLTIRVGMDGNVHVGVTTGVTQEASLEVGATFENDAWQNTGEYSNTFDYNPPTLSAGLNLKVFTGPSLSLLIYGVIGPEIKIDFYLELEADLYSSPWWVLYGGLEAQAGVKIEIFGHSLADYSATVIGLRWPLAQATTYVQHRMGSAYEGIEKALAVDLDGDLDMDVLEVAQNSETVSWWENTGTLSFTQHLVANLECVTDVQAADLDGDGDVDLMSTSDEYPYTDCGNGAAWWENNGSEIFISHTLTNTYYYNSYEIMPVDMDGDLDMDILVAGYDQLTYDGLRWFENAGGANFTEHVISTTTCSDRYYIDTGDIDSDGDTDIAVACQAAYTSPIYLWLENDGDENFTQQAFSDALLRPYDIVVVDLDQDGDQDILTGIGGDSTNLGYILWWVNDGNQNFTHEVIAHHSAGISSIYPVDLDADGDLDVLTATLFRGAIWWENLGDQVFIEHRLHPYEEISFLDIHAADLNGDGDLDIIAAGRKPLDDDPYYIYDVFWWEQQR